MSDWQNRLTEAGYTGSFDLASLIRACPPYISLDGSLYIPGFGLLYADPWMAGYGMIEGGFEDLPFDNGEGDTPEEAVASLWITLQGFTRVPANPDRPASMAIREAVMAHNEELLKEGGR
jgi:hypothetical protein